MISYSDRSAHMLHSMFCLTLFLFIAFCTQPLSAQQNCIAEFSVEDNTLPADGISETKVWIKIHCPSATTWFTSYTDAPGLDCSAGDCGRYLAPPGFSITEDVRTYCYYRAPAITPTAELSGIITVYLRMHHPESGEMKEVPMYIDIGQFIPPLDRLVMYPVTLNYSPADNVTFNELTVLVRHEDGTPVSEPHQIQFTAEPPFPNDGVEGFMPADGKVTTADGKARIIFVGPDRSEANEKLNTIKIIARDLTTGDVNEWIVPVGTLLAEAYPGDPHSSEYDSVAVIPADPGYPAKIIAHIGGNRDFTSKANREVIFRIESDLGHGILKSGDYSYSVITVKTDARGRAEAWYHFTGDYEGECLTDVVTIEDDTGEKRQVVVKTGLGLGVKDIDPVLTQSTPGILKEAQFGVLLLLYSEFHPAMVWEDYARNGREVWNGREIGVSLDLKWINRPQPGFWKWLKGIVDYENDVYSGRCGFDQKGALEGGYDVAAALDFPRIQIGEIAYPAMRINANGEHWFRASLRLIEKGSGSTLQEFLIRPSLFFAVNVDIENSYWRDLACAMSPQSKAEFWLQEAAKAQFIFEKLLQKTNPTISIFLAAQSAACKLMDGDYQGAVLDVGGALGELALDIDHGIPKYAPGKIPESTVDLYGNALVVKETATWTVRAQNTWEQDWLPEWLQWSSKSSNSLVKAPLLALDNSGYLAVKTSASCAHDPEFQDFACALGLGMLSSSEIYADRMMAIVFQAAEAGLSDETGVKAEFLDEYLTQIGSLMGAQVAEIFAFGFPKAGIYTLEFVTSDTGFIALCQQNLDYEVLNYITTTPTRGVLIINNGHAKQLELDYGADGSIDESILPVLREFGSTPTPPAAESRCTLLGGSGSEVIRAIAQDAHSNIFVFGYTNSTDFPITERAFDRTYNGDYDLFIAKFDNELKSLLAATYFGGTAKDFKYADDFALAITPGGDVIIAGGTASADLPTTSTAFSPSYAGGDNDAFIAVFDNNLETLRACTYLGGGRYEAIRALAIDKSGYIYATGYTNSTGPSFPVISGAYCERYNWGVDGFVCKLDGQLSSLLASSFIDNANWAVNLRGLDMLLDQNEENVFVLCQVGKIEESVNCPADGYDTSYNGLADLYVVEFDTALQNRLHATYFGSPGDDTPSTFCFDADGNLVITGITWSADFPTTHGVFNRNFVGLDYDAFTVILDDRLETLVSSTLLGGTGNDYAYDVAWDDKGLCIVAGQTASPDFPVTTGALDETLSGDNDGFISCFDRTLSVCSPSSFLGSEGGKSGIHCVVLDNKRSLVVAGYSWSQTFPSSPDCYDHVHNGECDAFIGGINLSLKSSTMAPWDGIRLQPPATSQLLQNYPNPFNGSTTVTYRLTVNGRIILKIYDLLGREVRTLVDSIQPAGVYAVNWDGAAFDGLPAPSGVYLYHLLSDQHRETGKMVMIQ